MDEPVGCEFQLAPEFHAPALRVGSPGSDGVKALQFQRWDGKTWVRFEGASA